MPVVGEAARQIFTRQSPFSDPGRYAPLFDGLPTDLAGLRRVSSGLVFHHRAGGDWAGNGIAAERIRDLDLRYVERMLGRLMELRPGLTGRRRPAERIVGNCRDVALLFVAMARHQGTPARMRVGFAGYLAAGWWLYHMVAEVWDGAGGRWRQVDPGLDAGHVDPRDGVTLDVLDLDHRCFLTGPEAWRACRSGAADPARFVVDPGVDEPSMRSWPTLAHDLSLDLAALNRVELLLWDLYGCPRDVPEPGAGYLTGPAAGDLPGLGAEDVALLDAVAESTAREDPEPAELRVWLDRAPFTIPSKVMSFSPARETPAMVALRA